ncbi:MAG: four helix bundle suffix domain-containing protein [Prevotella sp.]|nr:four helix bundle suffix domain-containing protein [Prevotella sp.]
MEDHIENNHEAQEQPVTFLPQHGHYSNLRVYQVAEMIYDMTFHFCHRFLGRGDRTVDQMVQAARSGKQNIAEGNQAAATSCETEIKLTNVAKSSLEELLKDYEDYLRVRNLPIWDRLHPRYGRMREYARGEQIRKEYSGLVARMSDEEIANLCITLIHQATYMLHRLLITMQDRFVKEGGIKERMFRSRMAYRGNLNNQGNLSNLNNRSNPNSPNNQNSQNNPNSQNNQNFPNSPNDSKNQK